LSCRWVPIIIQSHCQKGRTRVPVLRRFLPEVSTSKFNCCEIISAFTILQKEKSAKGKFRPLLSLLPSCDAMLSIRGISVKSNYRKKLFRAYVEPEYIQYLQYRFEWPNETIEIISWKCLSLAIQQINRDVLITKVCNDLLPTATTLCKMKYQHHDTSILCHQQETRDHIIRCTAPSRIKWRTNYINCYLKAAALLLFVLERLKSQQSTRLLFYSMLI
jgi:hypothetical protein